MVVAEGVESEEQRQDSGSSAAPPVRATSSPVRCRPERFLAALRRGRDGRPRPVAPALHEAAPVIRLPPRQSQDGQRRRMKTKPARVRAGSRDRRARTRVPPPACTLRRRPPTRLAALDGCSTRFAVGHRRTSPPCPRTAPGAQPAAPRLPDRTVVVARPACRPAAAAGHSRLTGRPGRAGPHPLRCRGRHPRAPGQAGSPARRRPARPRPGRGPRRRTDGRRLLGTGTPYLNRPEIAALPAADQLQRVLAVPARHVALRPAPRAAGTTGGLTPASASPRRRHRRAALDPGAPARDSRRPGRPRPRRPVRRRPADLHPHPDHRRIG